jgi:DNA-binding CsgD family transcriptional regulator
MRNTLTDFQILGPCGRCFGGRHGLVLTTRQAEILEHLATGARTNSIAEALFLSRQAVSYHITQMLTQFEAESRTGLVARAYHFGVLDATRWPPRVSPCATAARPGRPGRPPGRVHGAGVRPMTDRAPARLFSPGPGHCS